MKIGDEVYIHGYVDEIRSDVVIIRNDGGYFGTVPSEVKYDCDDCRHWWKSEDVCLLDNCHYEPKDEPLTCDGNCWMKKQNGEWLCEHCQRKPKTEPQTELVNDSPILVKDLVDDEFSPYDEECMRCKHLKLQCEFVPSYCKYEPRDELKTEPQSGYCNECKWYGDKQVCGRCRSRNLYAPKTEPQTCANGCKWLDQDGECTEPNGECHIEYRTQVDEPQTDCAWQKGE